MDSQVVSALKQLDLGEMKHNLKNKPKARPRSRKKKSTAAVVNDTPSTHAASPTSVTQTSPAANCSVNDRPTPSYGALDVRPLGTNEPTPRQLQPPLPPGAGTSTPGQNRRKASTPVRGFLDHIRLPGPSATTGLRAYSIPSRVRPSPSPAPEPAPMYLAQAQKMPRRLSHPQHMLLILDLNGTLLARSHGGRSWIKRPYFREFVDYCFRNHT